MPTTKALLFSSLHTAVHAWSYFQGSSAGLNYPGHAQQTQVFMEESANPNITTSVPVTLAGGQNFTFRVNVTDLALPGVDTSIDNPRGVVTTYDVTYEGDSSYNDTFMDPGPSCFTTTYVAFSGSVTNGASSDGDCTGAFGEDCVNALKQYPPDCRHLTFFPPSQCEDAFKGVGEFSGFNMTSMNGTDPLDLYAHNSAIMSASDSEDEYNDAAQQMYFALFKTGERPSVPICVRPSSDAAFLKRGSTVWMVAVAAATTIWIVI